MKTKKFTSLSNSITTFDIFGSRVGFNYQGHSRFKTVTGAFFSLGFLVFTIYVLADRIQILSSSRPETISVERQMINVQDPDYKLFPF